MIVTPEDIAEFREELSAYENDTHWIRLLPEARAKYGPDDSSEFARWIVDRLTPGQRTGFKRGRDTNDILRHFHRRPQLLIPSGFDEIRIEPKPARDILQALDDEFRRQYPDWTTTYDSPQFAAQRSTMEVLYGLRCRDTASGQWFESRGFDFHGQELLLGTSGDAAPSRRLGVRKVLDNCEDALTKATQPAVILLPNLWYPPVTYPRIELVDATKAILLALRDEKLQLKNLEWPQLEDVVGGLLRDRGMEVHMTPRSRDGGRDIVARGELIPGEPTTLAVEVKHKDNVGIGELRGLLFANKDFPVVMAATSGRYTAGVIREKQRPENFLRLLLKDGNALRDWINQYDR